MGRSVPHGSLQNQKLLRENQLLRERTCNLARENQELRSRLGLDALKTEEDEGDEFQVSRAAAVSAPVLWAGIYLCPPYGASSETQQVPSRNGCYR